MLDHQDLFASCHNVAMGLYDIRMDDRDCIAEPRSHLQHWSTEHRHTRKPSLHTPVDCDGTTLCCLYTSTYSMLFVYIYLLYAVCIHLPTLCCLYTSTYSMLFVYIYLLYAVCIHLPTLCCLCTSTYSMLFVYIYLLYAVCIHLPTLCCLYT